MSEADFFDVAIFGGGPAGAATAIFLARSGLKVSIRTRTVREGKRIGESLSPQCSVVLKQLGLWKVFLADGHSPCHGNKSIWGGRELVHEDFIRNHYGHAWHIDRGLFESRLLERARASGIRMIQDEPPPKISRENELWNLESSSGSIRARFLVDATGRGRWLARSRGARFISEDHQVALIAFYHSKEFRLEDSTNLIEATRTGWWYSAVLPDGSLAVAFMTDPDLHAFAEITTGSGLMKLLGEAPETTARILHYNYELAKQPRLVPANSGRLDSISGAGWLAVGDAAISLDPLAAHGLALAMTSGRDAADVIIRHLAGDLSALSFYSSFLTAVYNYYQSMRTIYYMVEDRWPEAQYWARRRTSTTSSSHGVRMTRRPFSPQRGVSKHPSPARC